MEQRVELKWGERWISSQVVRDKNVDLARSFVY